MIQSPPRRVFRQTVVLRLLLGLLFLLPAAFFLFAAFENRPIEPVPLVIGVVLLAIYAGLWVAIGKTTVTVYREGVRRSSVLGSRELLWSEIAEYRFRVIPVQTGGGVLGWMLTQAVQAAVTAAKGKPARSLKLTLVGRERKSIKVTSNFQSAEQAIDMIVQEIHERLKPELKRRLANGQEVSFGPLGLSLRGVSWKGKEKVPVMEIGKAEISRRKLRIRRKGKMLDALAVDAQKIPNVLLAVELIEDLRVNVGLGQVSETFA